MKFTPEVVAALEVLRAAAENDFERHRLDVLKKNLTAPPQVEIIDETHQRFNGVTYRKQPDSENRAYGHYVASVGIQRAVWSYHHGEIPDGHSIHHIDEDKDNNNAENLQCLSNEEHSHTHYSKGNPVAESVKRKFTCEFCGQEYEATDVGLNRYCSKQCRDKARRQRRCVERVCVICGKTFWQSRDHRAKTCSTACAVKLRDQTKQITRKDC